MIEGILVIVSFCSWLACFALLLFFRSTDEVYSNKQKLLALGAMATALCTSVVAFVIAAINGRMMNFAYAAVKPVSYLQVSILQEDPTACVIEDEPRSCAKYCCEDANDPSVVWRDCSPLCKSRDRSQVPKRQDGTGEECGLDVSKKAYCDITTFANLTNSKRGCNFTEKFGQITCACCKSRNEVDRTWWDCDNDCTSNGDLAGMKLPTSVCLEAGTNNYMCGENII